MNRPPEAVNLLLRQNSLQPYLHDRAIFATNRENWRTYTRDRTLTERQRDLVIDKLHIPESRRDDVRNRIELQRDFEGLVLSESLDFMTWAQKQSGVHQAAVPCLPPLTAERTKFVLCHLLQASFSLSPQDASAVLLAVNVVDAACFTGASLTYSFGSLKLSAAAKLSFAKAALAGSMGKAALAVVGHAANAGSWAMRGLSLTTGASASVAAIFVSTSIVQTDRQIWKDRRELGIIQYKDAAIFAVIKEINDSIVEPEDE